MITKSIPLFTFIILTFLNPLYAADEEFLGQQAEQGGKYREALTYYVSALQKTTGGSDSEQKLREKIIKLVLKIQPSPAVPEEAERYMARGSAAVKGATTAKDFEDAVVEFRKALRIAPWFAEGYYNLGVVQDKAGYYQDAIRSLKYYLLASPNTQDAKEVRSLIFEIEYRQEKAQKGTERKAAEQRANASLESLSGEYSEKMWGGTKVDWIPGVGSKAYSSKPTRNGPWKETGGSKIQVEITGNSIAITMHAISAQAVRAGETYQGTISGTRIQGTMTEKWNHRFSCPRMINSRFEGTLWPDDQVIMLMIEDCYFDGNPLHGLGCRHQQNDCYMNSYLLERKR